LLRAAEIQPHNEQAWFWLAYIADDPKDRLSYLRKILRINPEQKQAQSVLKKALLQAGISAARGGDKSQARLLFLEIVEIEPANEQAWLWLSSVSTTYKDVRHCLQRVLEINPSNQRAASWLSANRERQSTGAPAWTCPLCGFASAVKASRCSRCRSVLTLGDVNLILDNQDADRDLVSDAAERYRKVAETNSTFGLHYTLGLAYLNLKKPDNAMAYLRKALDLQPENRLLRSQIESLDRGLAVRLQAARETAARETAARETAAHEPEVSSLATTRPANGNSSSPGSSGSRSQGIDGEEIPISRIVLPYPVSTTADSRSGPQYVSDPAPARESAHPGIRPSAQNSDPPPRDRQPFSDAALLRGGSAAQDFAGERYSEREANPVSRASTAVQDPHPSSPLIQPDSRFETGSLQERHELLDSHEPALCETEAGNGLG
jgi:tetratricopeptide (TPR) repeat protein